MTTAKGEIVLHACCACCLIYPYKVLKAEGYDVLALWYNPNIQPVDEYIKRRDAFESYCRAHSITYAVLEDANDYAAEFYSCLMGFNEPCLPPDEPKRCALCWGLRLNKTARFAKEKGIGVFTSTLMVSIYQDVPAIIRLGKEAARAVGIDFLARDFREGFDAAHNAAREEGVYSQKWCGCIFSYQERLIKKYNKHAKAQALARIPR